MANSESPVYASPGDDSEMEQAAARARQTFRFFWREMAWERRRIIPGLELAAVKGSFADPPEVRAQNPEGLEVEHMWLIDVDFDGRRIRGTLINSPLSLKTFQEADDRGFTFLHQLALAGSWDGVDVCLKHGADPKQAAPNGMTPYTLAKSLGWKKVMARLEEAGAA